MKGRPEILFPLFAGLETLPGVGAKTAQNMAQLGLERPRDLLLHLPHSVIDRRRRRTIRGLELPAVATVEVEVESHRPARTRGGASGRCPDATRAGTSVTSALPSGPGISSTPGKAV